MSNYFILDDVINERGTEGFCVMFGDPWEARGFDQFTAKTMRECLAYLLPHITRGERVYRVKLARRHGEHKVSVLLGWNHSPFKGHGLWQARGFNAAGEHFNRAFRSRRECVSFLSKMRNGIPCDRY